MEWETRKPIEQRPELKPEQYSNLRSDKIVQVTGFGVANTPNTQCDYLLVGLTESGRVLMSTGDGDWADIT